MGLTTGERVQKKGTGSIPMSGPIRAGWMDVMNDPKCRRSPQKRRGPALRTNAIAAFAGFYAIRLVSERRGEVLRQVCRDIEPARFRPRRTFPLKLRP